MADPTRPRIGLVVGLLFVLVTGPVVGLTASGGVDTSVSYRGDAFFVHASEQYAWQTRPGTVELAPPEAATGELCLVAVPRYGPGNTTLDCSADGETVRFGVDDWPRDSGQYRLVLQWGPDDEEQVAVGSVTVITPGGDVDHDRLPNLAEHEGATNLTSADTDGDGLRDGSERLDYGTDPTSVDTDGDGLRDGLEVLLRTDPTQPTTRTDLGSLVHQQESVDDQPTSAIWVDTGMVTPLLAFGGLVLGGGAVVVARRVPVGEMLDHQDEDDRQTVDTEALPSPDHEEVVELLDRQGGRMEQSAVVEETDWSKAKVSRILTRLDTAGVIEKRPDGRRNVIVLDTES